MSPDQALFPLIVTT